ncbi:MAG: hypothetical protein CJBNEKGG_01030 [Prosthecobacter sp.]|nr:hypothetical protein [Prosthecobacter sp.]
MRSNVAISLRRDELHVPHDSIVHNDQEICTSAQAFRRRSSETRPPYYSAMPDVLITRKLWMPAQVFRSSCGARWLLCLRSFALVFVSWHAHLTNGSSPKPLFANQPPPLWRSIVAISLRRDELDVPLAQPSTMTQPSALRRKHSGPAPAKPSRDTARSKYV